jgi:hypothetical protein
MAIFEDSFINELVGDTEIELSRKFRAIFDRFSLAITAGTAVYNLPSGVFYIQQVSWKGEALLNMEHEDYQGDSNFLKPNSTASQTAKPSFYMLTNYGFNGIQFAPVPGVSIAADSSDLFKCSAVPNSVIINCYRLADVTSDQFRLPLYLLRNTIKYRVLQRSYMREGKGQNLQAAAYFEKKNKTFLDDFVKVYQKIPKVLLGEDVSDSGLGKKPARPSLPTSGAWSY